MHNAVIAGYSRSPFTISNKGELKSLSLRIYYPKLLIN